MGTSSSVESQAPEDGPVEDGPMDGPVVEELTFRVEAELLEPWLARESASWDDYLARQPGFLRKEVWLEAEDGASGTVRVLVWWASRTQWQAVPDDELSRVDDAMGSLRRHAQCRWYRVAHLR